MIGRPRMVDEESLADLTGPVRMLFHSQAPDRLPSSIMLYANMQGFKIGVEVEFAKKNGPVLPPSPPPRDSGNGQDDDDTQTEDQSRSEPHWKHASGKNKEKEVQQDGTGKSSGVQERNQRVSSPVQQMELAAPLLTDRKSVV